MTYSPGGGAGSIATASDVALSNVATGQILIFDATTGKWTNQNLPTSSGGGGGTTTPSSIAGASDAALTSPTDGQVLTFNAAAGKWVNATPASSGSGTSTGGYTKPSTGIPATDINMASVIAQTDMNAALFGLRMHAWAPTGNDAVLLGAGWQGAVWEVNSTGNATVYLPADATAAYATGLMVHFRQLGTGTVTFAADTGVTLQTADSLTLRKQYSSATVHKRAANTWYIEGDLA